MCELLLQLVSHVNPDPAQDLAGSGKRGYVVHIEDDGFAWGVMESIEAWVAKGFDPDGFPGTFAIIKIPGTPKADMEYLIQSLNDLMEEQQIVVRKRAWHCNMDLLPVPIRNQIDRNYVYTATKAQIDAVIEYLGL